MYPALQARKEVYFYHPERPETEDQAEAKDRYAPDVVHRILRDLVHEICGAKEGQEEHEAMCDGVPQLLLSRFDHLTPSNRAKTC